jgi:epoxyqueuosine reductase
MINPKYGSYMFLSTILIDKEITHDVSIHDNKCGDCTLCIDACPSGALDNGFNRDKCISHLSQTKMAFDEEQVSYFKKTIYGCDICLKACPKNKDIDFHVIPEFEPNGIENVWLEDLLLMSKKEFKVKFESNTSHWIGASTMRRNALCIIGNQNLVEYIPKIKKSMSVYKDNLWYNKTADIVLKKLERE